jgi:aspartate racemase
MTTRELVSHLRSLNVRVWAEDGQLLCNGPKGSLTAELRTLLAERKAEVLEFLKDSAATETGAPPPAIRPIPRDGLLPVSYAQQRMWFIDRLEPHTPLYNISSNVQLEGPLDIAALAAALNEIVRRHEVLRTTLPDVDGQPVPSLAAALEVPLPLTDLRGLSESDRREEIRRLSDREAVLPFDLGRGPLFRATLLRIGERDHVLLLTMHHIVSDGWSLFVLFHELAILYSAFSLGRPSPLAPLAPLPVQYADFAHWQQQRLSGDVLRRLLGYWENQLRNAPVLQLQSDRSRPPVQSYQGAEQYFVLGPQLTEALAELNKRENATLFMTLLAAFFVLLHRYTEQDDILVGYPIAGRNRAEIEGLIGLFVNTVVLRVDVSGEPTFRQVLKRVREAALEADAHQELPFEKLVERLQPQRNLSHHPLFQVMFVLQNAPAKSPDFAGLKAKFLRQQERTAKIDLMFTLREVQPQIEATVQYSTDLFDAPTVERMFGHYRTILENIVAQPDRRISELAMITSDQQQQLLTEWNNTAADYPRSRCIHEIFESQAERTPQAIAVVFNKQEVTYGELNARANRVGHYLSRHGVEREVNVALCMHRSVEMIVGILGVLKAGGAYVPLDPAYPRERLARILEDTMTPLVLTQGSLADLPAIAGCSIPQLRLDTDWPEIAAESADNLAHRAGPQSLAYIMYTSGSTGVPKGVCIEHRNVVRLVHGANYVNLGGDEVFLQFAPLSFDASTFEIWACLLHGSKLIVFPPHSPTLEELGEFIESHRVTTLWLTAALFMEMADSQLHHLRNVRQLLSGGDVLSAPHVRKVLAAQDGAFRLINGYGPTENTTFTCCHAMDGSGIPQRDSIPIGRPISNTTVYVLDRHRQPVPAGIPGELYTGGDGVARGYYRSPALTAERFFPDPFRNVPGARMYKTGDRVRHLEGGVIEFLGRMDDQVKIRGFRIEPGEIEAVLSRHPGVARVVVQAVENAPSPGKSLVAYIVPQLQPAPTINSLRSHVRESLPDYMSPTAYVFLQAIPRTANGKVDRRALPAPDRTGDGSGVQVIAPRDHVERQLADIWQTVLNIEPIGVTDSFFDLGGHSLLAVRVTSKIEKAFGRRLPLAAFFQAPTVEQVARILREEIQLPSWQSLIPIQTAGSRPPFFWIHGERSNDTLPRYFGPDQPLYGIAHQSEDGTPARYTSVEQIAAHYLREIRLVQPQGPYFLGGYCFGGMIAFEMAQQLTECNEKVALVALLAPSIPQPGGTARRWQRFNGRWKHTNNASPSARNSMRAEFSRHIRNLDQLETREKVSYVGRRAEDKVSGWFAPLTGPVKKLLQRTACAALLHLGYPVPVSLRNFYILDVYRRAMRRYRARPYRGSVALFLPHAERERPLRAWGELSTPEPGVIEFPGEHTEILQEPNVKVWAEQLHALLDSTQSTSHRGIPIADGNAL